MGGGVRVFSTTVHLENTHLGGEDSFSPGNRRAKICASEQLHIPMMKEEGPKNNIGRPIMWKKRSVVKKGDDASNSAPARTT